MARRVSQTLEMGHGPGTLRAGTQRAATPVNLACLPAADICEDHHASRTSSSLHPREAPRRPSTSPADLTGAKPSSRRTEMRCLREAHHDGPVRGDGDHPRGPGIHSVARRMLPALGRREMPAEVVAASPRPQPRGQSDSRAQRPSPRVENRVSNIDHSSRVGRLSNIDQSSRAGADRVSLQS
jgi:hypothetical protein